MDNLLAGIQESRKQGLTRALVGLGIRHVGWRAAQTLAQQFGDIDAIMAANVEQLSNFEVHGKPSGIGPEIANSVYTFFQSDAGKHVAEELRAAGVNLTEKKAIETKPPTGPFAGKTVVLTGTLESFKRNELKEKLEALGATVTDSVSKKTGLLIAGRRTGQQTGQGPRVED